MRAAVWLASVIGCFAVAYYHGLWWTFLLVFMWTGGQNILAHKAWR